MIKTLTFTTLFPNSAQPVHGIFVENRLRHLLESGEVSTTVVAPVPWVPPFLSSHGQYGRYRRIGRIEQRDGLDVFHPRYPVIPKVGMPVAPALLAAWSLPFIRSLRQQTGDFDLIDAHYFYPDGVAATILGQRLGKPVVITGRGTDLSLIPSNPLARRQIQWAAARAAGMITVCEALVEPLVEMGVERQRVTVLRNGVDLIKFHPGDREAARRKWGLTGPALASVGLLIERKGHHLVIEALASLPGVTLLIAGDGPERRAYENHAAKLGVVDRVRFLGNLPHSELRDLYVAVDALVLASSREGWANVLLESMACGTPVVATRIWGTPEVVRGPSAGVLVPERSAAALVGGVQTVLSAAPDRADVRVYAERFDWSETTLGQLKLFKRILN